MGIGHIAEFPEVLCNAVCVLFLSREAAVEISQLFSLFRRDLILSFFDQLLHISAVLFLVFPGDQIDQAL